MAEVFFAAAWTAGVIEGGSLLRRASQKANGTDTGTLDPTLLVPSVLYGTLALPLGVIGASPGASMAASLPLAPSLKALESSMSATLSENAAAPLEQPSATPASPIDRSSYNSSSHQSSSSTMDNKRSEMIRRARQENRRSLEQARRKQAPPPAAASPSPSIISRTARLASLDGRPLPTPLAESMRRARFLLVGAGLVMTMVQYQSMKDEKERQQAILNVKQRQCGRSVEAIQSLIRNAQRQQGSVVRLVSRGDLAKWEATNPSYNVLPVVCPTLTTLDDVRDTSALESSSPGASSVAFWNLGRTSKDWSETPVTREWLTRSSHLIMEADVSGPLSEYFVHSKAGPVHHFSNGLSRERANLGFHLLSQVAQEKGVIASGATVKVLIGSDPPNTGLDAGNTVYIHGPTALGVEIVSVLERAKAELDVFSELEKDQTMEASENEEAELTFPKSTEDFISMMELIGRRIRQGGEVAVSVTGKAWQNLSLPHDRVVHVLSDQPSTVQSLQQTLAPNRWSVRRYSALTDAGRRRYLKEMSTRGGGIYLVSCRTDEATCSMVASLLSELESGSSEAIKLVVLLERSASADFFESVNQSQQKPSVIGVSIQAVHSSLFSHARDLLASGKTPAEVQDLLSLIQ